ncbi:MAG TPA: hypothetical protein VJ036_03080 [bacterium]|nr:hypothetical protein [bacterium]
MPSFFDHWQAENKATSLEAEGAPWLLKQKLVPEAGHQGRLRIRFNLAAETLSTLEEYLACFAKNDASVMFTLPMLPAQQALTWLQAEPLPALRSLLPRHLDIFGRWGAHLGGEFPDQLAGLLAPAGVLTWQGGPLAEYATASQVGTWPDYVSRYANVDRLAYNYTKAGIPIRREVCGLNTSTMVPPGLLIAAIVLEARLVREQGAEDISVAYRPNGHLLQDVAALRALAVLTRDLSATITCLPWAGGALLGGRNLNTIAAWTAITSSLGASRRCEIGAVDEGRLLSADRIISLMDLAQGMICLANDQRKAITAAAHDEEELLQIEATAIINRVLELGKGEVVAGIKIALAQGSLDFPLVSAGICQGQVLSARDATGALRFLDSGALPLPAEVKQKHTQLLEERARSEGRGLGTSLVIDDVYAFSKGNLVGTI